jgi:NhaP-type Na+/H+ or K+/H+ antiporter
MHIPYVVVIFSILVQALTMGRLVRHLDRGATLEPPGQKG